MWTNLAYNLILILIPFLILITNQILKLILILILDIWINLMKWSPLQFMTTFSFLPLSVLSRLAISTHMLMQVFHQVSKCWELFFLIPYFSVLPQVNYQTSAFSLCFVIGTQYIRPDKKQAIVDISYDSIQLGWKYHLLIYFYFLTYPWIPVNPIPLFSFFSSLFYTCQFGRLEFDFRKWQNVVPGKEVRQWLHLSNAGCIFGGSSLKYIHICTVSLDFVVKVKAVWL